MKKIVFAFTLLMGSLILQDCAPTRFVTPLEQGEWAGGINVGGPLIEFGGTKIPVPFSSIYAGYGYTERTTLYGGLHTTSLAFKTFQLDAGANYLLRKMQGQVPGISANGTLNLMADFREFGIRAYPSVALNAFYDLKYGRLYAGMDNWLDFFPNATPDNSQHNLWVPAFHIGQAIKYKKWEFNFEYKYLAPYTSNQDIVVRYATARDNGAHGLYFTIQKKF